MRIGLISDVHANIEALKESLTRIITNLADLNSRRDRIDVYDTHSYERLAKLLAKDVVRRVLSHCPGWGITPEDFETVWPQHYECYRLRLDT